MKRHYDIIIVGAGLSGLTCAAKCAQSGLDYLLLEKSGRIGGRVGSIAKDGYIFDLGFQVYNSSYQQASRISRISPRHLRPFKPGAAIFTNGKLHVLSDPFRDPEAVFTTLFFPYATWLDKIKILSLKRHLKDYDFFRDQSEEHSTLEFLQNFGFSNQIIHSFFKPFFAGVFLEEELGTSDRFFKFVFSSLNKGLATLPEGGMQQIPSRLQKQISNNRLHCNTEIEKIDSNHLLTLANGHQLSFRKLVLTGESSRFASDQPLSFNSVFTVYVSTHLSIPKPKYIHLYPDDDLLNHMAVVSAVSPSYSSHYDHLLSVTLLGNRGKQKGVNSEVIHRLSRFYGGTASDYEIKESMFLEKATLLQKPGAFQPRKSKHPNILCAGDIQTHGSIEGAVLSGESAFDKLRN